MLRPEDGQGLADEALGLLHGVDMRKDAAFDAGIEELARVLKTSVPPLGPVGTVPALPERYVARKGRVDAIAAHLLADIRAPVVVGQRSEAASLTGMVGIGKSVLAAAFARSTRARRNFEDGVIWLKAGDTPPGDPIRHHAPALGEILREDALRLAHSEEGAAHALALALHDRRCLIVLDDVRNVDLIPAFRARLGPRCRLLTTSRNLEHASANLVEIDELETDEARALLADLAGLEARDLPAEAQAIIETCGRHPYALALSGAMVRDNPARWADVLEILRDADHEELATQLPGYSQFPHLLAALTASVGDLGDDELALYQTLAIFAEDQPIPARAIETFWAKRGRSARKSRFLIDRFRNKSLLRQDDGTITLHDLMHDYVRAQWSEAELCSLHAELVDAYAAACEGAFATLADDGYVFAHMIRHMLDANRAGVAKALQGDLRWLHAQLAASGIPQVLDDIERLEAAGGDAPVERLRILGQTLRLAAPVLLHDPGQFAGQLLGRLGDDPSPETAAILEDATSIGSLRQFIPKRPNLVPPRSWLVTAPISTLEGGVRCAAIGPSGRLIVRAIGDPEHGIPARIDLIDVDRDTDEITLAHDLADKLAISQDGKSLAVLTADGKLGIRALDDVTAKPVILDTALGDPQAKLLAIEFASDGRLFAVSSCGPVHVWHLDGEAPVRTSLANIRTEFADRLVGFFDDQGIALAPDAGVCFIPLNGERNARGRVRRTELRTGRSEEFTLDRAEFDHLACTRDGTVLATAKLAIKRWRLTDAGLQADRVLPGHGYNLRSLALTPNGDRILSSTYLDLCLWNPECDPLTSWKVGRGETISHLHLAGMRAFAGGTPGGYLRIIDVRSGAEQEKLELPSPLSKLIPLARTRLAAACWHEIAFVDTNVGEVESIDDVSEVVGSHEQTVGFPASAFGPPGKVFDLSNDGRIALIGNDRSACLVDLGSGTITHETASHSSLMDRGTLLGGQLFGGRFSPEANRIILLADRAVMIWEPGHGQLWCMIDHHDYYIDHAAFWHSPTGLRLVTGGRDKTIRIWDLETGRTTATLRRHNYTIGSLIVDNARHELLSCGGNTLILWDLLRCEHGDDRPISTFTADTTLWCCDRSKDGSLAVAGDLAGNLHVFEITGYP